MSLSIDAIKARIAEYEQEIVKVVNNHASLVGGLNELKQLLALGEKVAEVVAPEEAPVVEAINEVVGEVIDAVQPE